MPGVLDTGQIDILVDAHTGGGFEELSVIILAQEQLTCYGAYT